MGLGLRINQDKSKRLRVGTDRIVRGLELHTTDEDVEFVEVEKCVYLQTHSTGK